MNYVISTEILITEFNINYGQTLDVKQYDNMEQPPPGSIWRRSTKDAKRTTVSQQVSAATTGTMNDAFTSMALSIASALGHSPKIHTPPRPSTPSERGKVTLEAGVSPGRLADLQGKCLAGTTSQAS